MNYLKLIEKAQNRANKQNKVIYCVECPVDGFSLVTPEDLASTKNVFFAVFPKN
jgi:hypothetical protein